MPKAKRKLEVGEDFLAYASEVLGPERMQQATERARQTLFILRLAELREREGLTQSEVPGFSQPSISKLESRTDVRLSKVASYLDSLEYDMQILAIPRKKGRKPMVLLESPSRTK